MYVSDVEMQLWETQQKPQKPRVIFILKFTHKHEWEGKNLNDETSFLAPSSHRDDEGTAQRRVCIGYKKKSK